MYAPVEFRERPRSAQIIGACVVPIFVGLIAGILLGVAAGAYWVFSALAAAGAVVGGLEHASGREAAQRGAVGGALYGIALLVMHAIVGTHAKTSLGGFPPLLILITAILGACLSAVGSRAASGRGSTTVR